MKEYTLKVLLPYPTMSGNKMRKMHWAPYRKMRQDAATIIASYIHAQRFPRAMRNEKRRVEIVRHGSRMLDPDNLVAGVKPVVDALRDCVAIWDDDPSCIDLVVRQVKSSRSGSKTEITVGAVEAAPFVDQKIKELEERVFALERMGVTCR